MPGSHGHEGRVVAIQCHRVHSESEGFRELSIHVQPNDFLRATEQRRSVADKTRLVSEIVQCALVLVTLSKEH